MNRLWPVGLITIALSTSGCFKKQNAEEMPLIVGNVTVEFKDNPLEPSKAHMIASGECNNFSSMLFVYQADPNTQSEVRAECAPSAQASGKMEVSKKRLDVKRHTWCREIEVKVYGILLNQRSNPKSVMVNFCNPMPPTSGYAITSGGGLLSGVGMTAFVSIGEPVSGADQTNANATLKSGLVSQVFDPD